jgi:hypothetical protein
MAGRLEANLLPGQSGIPPFSRGADDAAVPPGWRHQLLPKVRRANLFTLVDETGDSVLQVQSDASASMLVAPTAIDPAATPYLRWRWKVSRSLSGSDLRTKAGDDYGARLYVLFDLPLDRLSLTDQLTLRAARFVGGGEIPTAALCYIWGNAQPPGSTAWNAYTNRLRMIVVESGSAYVGRWRPAVRNVARDYREAFGGEAPHVIAVAVGADTDNTRESVETRFGNLSFGSSP